MIEKDENPKSYVDDIEYIESKIDKQGRMIMPGPVPPAPSVDRVRKTAIKLMELAIDILKDPERDPNLPIPMHKSESEKKNK